MKITRELAFDAGHRVLNHESHCHNPHGHRYKVEVVAEAETLDPLGRVIDFSVLKSKIGSWIDQHWDHTFIVYAQDRELIEALERVQKKKPVYILFCNPTAENLAQYLLSICQGLMDGTGIKITQIILWETPNCKAEASL